MALPNDERLKMVYDVVIKVEDETLNAKAENPSTNVFFLIIPSREDLDGKSVDMQFENGPLVSGLVLTHFANDQYRTEVDG